MKPLRLALWCLTLGTVAGLAQAAPTLIDNIHGYTLTDTGLRQFGALAFDAGKVLKTGDPSALRREFPGASRVDGGGRTLLPGLIDAHGHVMSLGLERTRVQLTDTRNLEEALQLIRRYAASHPDSGWVLGAGWNQVTWGLGRFPLASELDRAVLDRPAALERVDGHAMWLNSRGLKAAGIDRNTHDPPGGRIEHTADGEPSGVLVDKAVDLLRRVLPQPGEAERRAALQTALHELNAVGLTAVADAGDSAADISLLRAFADEGRLTVRTYAMVADGADFTRLLQAGPLSGYAADRLSVRAVKLFADGALGSRGAALLAPYSDAPAQRGLLFMTPTQLQGKMQTALRAGFQVNVHAIGDAANREVLDAFQAAYAAVGGRGLRNRIEHAQVVDPADIPRFRQLDLIASMQPTHATSDMNMAQDRLGAQRLRGAYAWRTFLAQGTRIAAGSDFPVESPNPFFGLYSAVTRMDHAGHPAGGWHAEQALTLPEAFRAFTLDAACAQHMEHTIGSLEPGKWADFILVDRDLFRIPAADIWKIKVDQTWVAGTRVYSR